MVEFQISSYELKHVLENDRILFNVNNLYEENRRPGDYFDRSEQTCTRNWIELFHHDNYAYFDLDEKDLSWMVQAAKIGSTTLKFSSIFRDELKESSEKHRVAFENGLKKLNCSSCFIRSDSVSLKYGIYGPGPYSDISKVLESMVTSSRGHLPFKEEDSKCRVYLMKWIEMEREKEFRIFVCRNRITAISQQYLYQANLWLSKLSNEEIIEVLRTIVEHFEAKIKDKLAFLENYTMDLVLLRDNTCYFIETNPFGREYSSGSALFHWISDDQTLRGDGTRIELRFVKYQQKE
jgi:hypothetical protein